MLSVGILVGGGVGFYWRETRGTEYLLKERELLEEELRSLREERKEKERQLAYFKEQSN